MEDLEKLGKFETLHLGGTGTMYLVHGETKNYIYKPAESKFSHQKEPFRGIVQECAYELQEIVDPVSAVVCRYVDAGKICGSVQELIVVDKNAPDYRDMQYAGQIPELSSSEVDQFMREFVTDYLLYNYDSHGKNFITDQQGIIRGIDKEQSFRYMREKKAQTLDLYYSPNAAYGEAEPIYNTIFRAYRDGKLDIDYSVISGCMDRVEAVSEDRYRAIFAPYCEACGKAFGQNPNEMLDQIVARRNTMREKVDTFFQGLTEEREVNLSSGKGK